ncbi:MGDG synthase family glycosyltransferase [Sporosalibacterium faouarense]|uniref:MGDG synthase family glycosyltransferase n=1 Tax=Sporosalibacterium faouarense TaxID=516123 RepID=UPI00192B1A73|nr:glycosyltransferase [Sporosalibacterium faouarense]
MSKNNCDILVLTATFGDGHKFVANAIKEQVLEVNENINVSIVDIFEIVSPKLSKGIYKGYEFFIKTNSNLYNYFYYKKDNNKRSQTDELILKLYLKDFADYVIAQNPKIIISTFPICSGFVSKIKERYKVNIALITCITDAVDSWEWIYPYTDRYFVANEDIKAKLINKGIDEEIIVSTGIPVRREFLNNENRDRERDDNRFKLLIMGGGIGLLPEDLSLYRWLDKLENVKTIVVTGNNVKLMNKLETCEDLKNITVYGYTNRISDLMKEADVLVSKAGGVTLFEAITSNLPIIAHKPTLGQEIANGRFIIDKKIGNVSRDVEGLKEQLNYFIEYDDYRRELNQNLFKLHQTFKISDMKKHILDLYVYYKSYYYYQKSYKFY